MIVSVISNKMPQNTALQINISTPWRNLELLSKLAVPDK